MGEDADIFVSYARRGEARWALIEKLKTATEQQGRKLVRQSASGELEEIAEANLRFDEESLRYGESILGFMKKVAEARHLILLISDEYLRSPYCMYELVSAFNAIENRYWPSIVFIASEPERDGAILSFEDGLPRIDPNRLADYWRGELKRLQERNPDDPACPWYRKNIRMASELTAWLIGRRWHEKPARLLDPWPLSPDPDGSEALVAAYLQRAVTPLENRHPCPSSDRLRDAAIVRIIQILRDEPVLEKALNRGNRFAHDGERRRKVGGWLDRKEGAGFIQEELAPVLEKARVNEAYDLYRASERLFAELVKFGVRIDTLHHRLREMDDMNEEVHVVAPASVIPEMADAFLRARPAGFRKVVGEGGKARYLGNKELEINGEEDVLESQEIGQDAVEQLNGNLQARIWDLYYPNREAYWSESVFDELPDAYAREMILTIRSMDHESRQELAVRLRGFQALNGVPFYGDEVPEGCVAIDLASGWYGAINSYYQALEQLEQRLRQQEGMTP